MEWGEVVLSVCLHFSSSMSMLMCNKMFSKLILFCPRHCQVISQSLSQPTNIFIVFSPSVLLRESRERVAQFVSGSQTR